MNGKKYIYNPAQANFFMEYGLRCLGTGINPNRNNRVYWIFDYHECQKAYEIWNNRKH